VGRVPPGDAVSSLGEGRLVYMGVIFILNGMWAQDKIYFGWHFAWVKYFTYHLHSSTSTGSELHKKHVFSSSQVRKICYSLDKVYVKSVS
jgi:hypothetical protein